MFFSLSYYGFKTQCVLVFQHTSVWTGPMLSCPVWLMPATLDGTGSQGASRHLSAPRKPETRHQHGSSSAIPRCGSAPFWPEQGGDGIRAQRFNSPAGLPRG